jgi:hypothetical protein
MTRRLAIPAVVAIWGAAVVINHLVSGSGDHTSGAFHSGQNAAVLLGAVMAVLGTIYFVRALRAARPD